MCFGNRNREEEAEAARSRELDKAIRADEKRMSKEVKLLLLGTNRLQNPVLSMLEKKTKKNNNTSADMYLPS